MADVKKIATRESYGNTLKALAAEGHDDLEVLDADLAGVGDGVADLLKGTACGKHGKAGNKGNITHGGQTCGHAHHVALGNAAVKVTVRVSLAEHAGLGGSGKVCVQHHQILVALCGQLLQGVAVAFTGSNFLHICHLSFPPAPARRMRRSVPQLRSCTRHRWGPCRASPQSWSYRKRPCPLWCP